MPTELPYAADAEMSLNYDELEVLRIQYQKELAQNHVTIQTKFNYSWGLIKSPMRDHQVEGVRLLQEIYRAEPARRRECLYYLALGHYKMGNFEEARKFNALLIEKEPTNLQAQSLGQLIQGCGTRRLHWHGPRWWSSSSGNPPHRRPHTASSSQINLLTRLRSDLVLSHAPPLIMTACTPLSETFVPGLPSCYTYDRT